MNKKKILIITLIVLIIIAVIISITIVINKNNDMNNSENLVAIFHGGGAEVYYETYIYKINNGHANSGFKYINKKLTTKRWGSSETNEKITGTGTVQWTDDVFIVAEENHAYSYVTIPNDDKTYTIDDFMGMFLMN